MTIEQAIDTALKDSSELAALVDDRVYYGKALQGTESPFVEHQQISDPPIPQLPFRRPRWQFSCWAEQPDQAKAIARIIRNLFSRYKGVMGGTEGVIVKQGADNDTRPYQDPQTNLWNALVEIYFIHREGS